MLCVGNEFRYAGKGQAGERPARGAGAAATRAALPAEGRHATGGIHGVEALLRWQHPQRGLILPGEFIPLAEACGLIDSIGEWVVREGCRQARAWQLEGLPPLRIAVNLSALQFRHGNLLQMIREALKAADLEPRFLEVEITESALMSDPEESVTILEQLSRMGVVVSVDDFGTGYSSMSYLRRFPIDKLKIRSEEHTSEL